jgi:uncharacterized damage-inducible protein DinB
VTIKDERDAAQSATLTAVTGWEAPQRIEPPLVAEERAMLEAWLDYHRDTLLMKCAGLSAEQLAERSCPPSSLSLLGLVRHMSEVERSWFLRGLDRRDAPGMYYSPDDPDGDFDNAAPTNADEALSTFRAEIEAAREAASRYGLDDVGMTRREGEELHSVSLRWIYLHMIEEYARHNGHADLLRERIDGVTGD